MAYFQELLLMDKILHQLIGSLSHYFQGFIHTRRCRISSINSMLVSGKVTISNPPNLTCWSGEGVVASMLAHILVAFQPLDVFAAIFSGLCVIPYMLFMLHGKWGEPYDEHMSYKLLGRCREPEKAVQQIEKECMRTHHKPKHSEINSHEKRRVSHIPHIKVL